MRHPPTDDFIEELANIKMSVRLRLATALKNANQYDLAETVFPDMPDYSDPHTYLRTAREMELDYAREVA